MKVKDEGGDLRPEGGRKRRVGAVISEQLKGREREETCHVDSVRIKWSLALRRENLKAKAVEMAKKDDLRERTKKYASAIIRFYCRLPKEREEVRILGRQLLRSGTSVAANYREASRARSDLEFVSKIELCSQEADESSLWLELLWDDCQIVDDKLEWLLEETEELISIFVTMSKNVKCKEKVEERMNLRTAVGSEYFFRSQVSAFIPHVLL